MNVPLSIIVLFIIILISISIYKKADSMNSTVGSPGLQGPKGNDGDDGTPGGPGLKGITGGPPPAIISPTQYDDAIANFPFPGGPLRDQQYLDARSPTGYSFGLGIDNAVQRLVFSVGFSGPVSRVQVSFQLTDETPPSPSLQYPYLVSVFMVDSLTFTPTIKGPESQIYTSIDNFNSDIQINTSCNFPNASNTVFIEISISRLFLFTNPTETIPIPPDLISLTVPTLTVGLPSLTRFLISNLSIQTVKPLTP